MTKDQAIAIFKNLCNNNILDAYNERLFAMANQFQESIFGFCYCEISDWISSVRIFDCTKSKDETLSCKISIFYKYESKKETEHFEITMDEFNELKFLYFKI